MSEISVQSSKTQKGGTDKKKTVSSKSRADLSQSLDSPVKQILYLQRTIGNRAVTHLFQSGAIQARFKIGKPNDIYEKEADRVSERVMRRRDESLVNGNWSLGKEVTPLIQRQEQPEEEEEKNQEEEEQLQTKPIADQITPLIQRQAEPEEEEVQTKLQRQEAEEEEEEPVQTMLLQRQEDKEEEAQAKPLIQREAEEKEEEEPAQTKLVQRQENEEEEKAVQRKFLQRQADEEEDAQAKPLIQRDAEEKEEEGQTKPLIQREAEEKEEEGQTKPLIHRQAEEKEEEGQTKPLIQRKPGNNSRQYLSSSLESRLSASKGGGQPMSPDTRSFMESRFGADFSSVRIHTNGEADAMNKDIKAQAFTTGKDIYFGSGRYNTSTSQGKQLLAHELTHVVQQGGAGLLRKTIDIPLVQPKSPLDLPKNLQEEENKTKEIPKVELEKSPEGKSKKTGAKKEISLKGPLKPEPSMPVEDKKKTEEPGKKKEEKESEEKETKEEAAKKEKSPPPPPEKGAAAPAEGKTGSKEKSAEKAPDLSGLGPEAAMAALKGMPPARISQALGDVSTSVSNSVGQKRAALAESPPQIQRPSGAPVSKAVQKKKKEPPKEKGPESIEKAPEGESVPVPKPEPLPTPPQSPITAARSPAVKGDKEGKVSSEDVAAMQSALYKLPARDPGLKVSAGAPQKLKLKGNAEPGKISNQKGKLNTDMASAEAAGQKDVAQDMGENEIYPVVPPETLRANVPESGAPKKKPAAAARLGEAEEAISIIAREQKGTEIDAAAAAAMGKMASQKKEHETKSAKLKAQSKQEINQLVKDNSAAQQKERTRAMGEVNKLREKWSTEQKQEVSKAKIEADKVSQAGQKDISKKQADANKQAAAHIAQGDREAARHRQEAERTAAKEKAKAKEESSGVFGWLSSKVKSFFNKIKTAIKAAFDYARKLVRAAIAKAKKLANTVIEKARQAVVGIIKKVGNVLIAIGDRVLAAFPKLREKFRGAIKSAVAKAEKTVNAYADKLKKDVQKALDLVGAGLDKALGLLEKGLNAIVDGYQALVLGAIKGAQAFVKGVMAFAALIADVAADPLGWLKKLGAAVVDGIKLHLWKEFKKAVREWFNQKLESILGLGKVIWDLIKKGGIKIADIGKMAWEGIKALIPTAIIQILVEKLVALIVPAAGALMVIIEGLQAAWGAVSRILQAFQKFFAFLKAVKTGKAAVKFAQALAAAAVAIIDFVANWLLLKLAKGAAKVGKKIKKFVKAKFKKLKAKIKKKFKKKKKGKEKKKKMSPEEKRRKIRLGLAAIDREEKKYLDKGKIEKKEAKKVARTVKRRHRVFMSIKVIDGGTTWDYKYIASPPKTKKGEKKEQAPTGKKNDPIPLEWPKRWLPNYKSFWLAPKEKDSNGNLVPRNPMPQEELKKVEGARKFEPKKVNQDVFKAGKIGVASKNQTNTDLIVGQKTKSIRGDGVPKFKKLLYEHGFSRIDNADAPTDMDHVVELQIGGKDEVENLWPLNSSENRRSGRVLNRKKIKYMNEKGEIVDDPFYKLKNGKYWFKLK
jgi:hypothetical protein